MQDANDAHAARLLTDLAFSPTNDRVAFATYGGVDLRTWPGLDLVRTWKASSAASRKVCFHPAGRRLAVSRLDGALVVLDVEGDGRVELWREECCALAYDVEGSLYAHGTYGVVAWMDRSRTPTVMTEQGYGSCFGSIWDTLLLPRRRKTLYGQNDVDGLMLDWRTGERMQLRAFLGPHEPKGASIFSLAANASETCIAFGGKHAYVNVVRTSLAFEPLSCELRPGGGRVVILAHHPRRDVLAAVRLGGRIAFLDPVTGDPVRDPYQEYDAMYPVHG